ncbi:MAG: hypothetical protein FWE99_01930 [Bacteroidales bacterium]|nr:hypothetical protein [Bacteroidales bacterium]
METVAGIKYTKGPNGGRGLVLIDLDVHGDNELLEDFLDLMEINACKNESKRPLRDIIAEQNQKRGLNV